jgi:DNA mismatch repair protein MutL
MSLAPPSSRRIHILREEVARKIAAGEVIDRPFSVVRELLDNAIDAGARTIECTVEGGGIRRVRVVDDGFGMSREDLEICAHRHATSKIREEEDLYRARTLGFRGEALASIGVCSRLEIVSMPAAGPGAKGRPQVPDRGDARVPAGASAEAEGFRLAESRSDSAGMAEAGADVGPADRGGAGPAHRLLVQGGRTVLLESCQGRPGTAVEAADLFFNMPARRKFLKSQAAETALCRQAFVEKALPHPDVTFRLLVEGRLKLFLPACGLRERVSAATGLELRHLFLLRSGSPGESLDSGAAAGAEGGAPARIQAVVGRPELARSDRRSIQVYVNRRRVYEYGLVQAVEYAFSQHLPGGRYPVAFLFLEVAAGLADFNIHPAKREVRLRRLPEIRQELIGLLKGFLKDFSLRPASGPGDAPEGPQARPAAPPSPGALDLPPRAPQTPPLDWKTLAERTGREGGGGRRAAEGSGGPAEPAPLYRGRAFGLFLLAELNDRLYIVDQHAAHERLLYEKLIARPVQPQELLFPIRLEASREEEDRLARRRDLFEGMGIRLEPAGPGGWQITALPEDFLAIGEKDLVRTVLGEEGSPEELRDAVYSLAACRLAVKDGEELDPLAAQQLLSDAFRLPDARCPHGRPIWHAVDRAEILRAVGRPWTPAPPGGTVGR